MFTVSLSSRIWCPPEQGGRWSHAAVVVAGLVPQLNPLRMFLLEVGQESSFFGFKSRLKNETQLSCYTK